MGEKDKSQKLLEDYADIFADIVNVLAFHGERLLQEGDIIPGPTESIYKAESGGLRSQFRDVVKLDQRGNILFSIIGLENQSTVDPDMVLRVMKYNALSYQSQIDRKAPDRRAVITLVLYFGTTRWQDPKTLFDRITTEDVPYKKYLPELVENPKLNLIEVAFLPEEVQAQFKSDFKYVAGYFTALREGRELAYMESQHEAIHHVKEVFEFFRVFTNNPAFETLLPAIVERAEKGEPISMSNALGTALDRALEKGIEKGIEKGREQGKLETAKETALKMLNDGIPARTILKYVEVSPDVLKNWQLEQSQNERE